MNNAFFENTFASYVRMYYQKTYDAIMATPLNLDEIITGEIVWGAVKSLIATMLMVAVISFFRLLVYPQALLIVPLAFLGGLAFGSVAMCFTALVPQIEVFNFPIFLFITPMFLFSGYTPCNPGASSDHGQTGGSALAKSSLLGFLLGCHFYPGDCAHEKTAHYLVWGKKTPAKV